MKFSFTLWVCYSPLVNAFPSFAIAGKRLLCSMVMHNVIMDSGHTCRESRHLLLYLRVLVAAAPDMALSECIRYSVINCGPIGTASSG